MTPHMAPNDPKFMKSKNPGKGVVTGGTTPGLRHPTLRQRRLFVELQKRNSFKEAVVAAGYSPNTSNASDIVKALSRTTLRERLHEIGIDVQYAAKHAKEGLEAMHTKALGHGESITEPDWANRHRYFTTVMRIMGIQTTGPQKDVAVDNSVHLKVYKNVFNIMEESLSQEIEAEVTEADE